MNKNKIQDVLKQIKRIDISTKNKAYGSLSGNYYSVFKGQGLEFSEIREYRIGDDVRAIDWKVTARLNSPHIKEFIEERNLQVYLMIGTCKRNGCRYGTRALQAIPCWYLCL